MNKAEQSSQDLKPSDLRLAHIVRFFNPAWFAAVMGTAVVPLAMSFTGADWTPWVARVMIPLAGGMFLLFLVPWTLKIFKHPAESAKDFNHPVASSFLPTMPISLVIISLDLLKFGHLFFSAEIAQALALSLWIVGSGGIFLLGFTVLVYVFRHEGIELGHANFGWLIPPVSKLLIPVAGFELAGKFPEHLELITGVSFASLGIGFFLFLFVGSAVYQRYLFKGLPVEKFAATFFIGIAPPAIIVVALIKLLHLVSEHEVLGLTGNAMAPFATIAILMCWGLAAWWFVMGILLVAYYRLARSLPFALSWWAFTFPSGALAISSGVAWQVSQLPFIRVFYNGVMGFLLVVWLIVFARTIMGIISRRLFMPTH